MRRRRVTFGSTIRGPGQSLSRRPRHRLRAIPRTPPAWKAGSGALERDRNGSIHVAGSRPWRGDGPCRISASWRTAFTHFVDCKATKEESRSPAGSGMPRRSSCRSAIRTSMGCSAIISTRACADPTRQILPRSQTILSSRRIDAPYRHNARLKLGAAGARHR